MISTTKGEILQVRDLEVEFVTPEGVVHAVNGVQFTAAADETLCIIGESGSGKTVSALALLSLLGPKGRVVSGTADFLGTDLLKLSEKELRRIRGRDIGFVRQEPMKALNPVLKIGTQIAEAIYIHNSGISKKMITERVLDSLSSVGISDPRTRYRQYPHELSGGMLQRVLIAIAICNNPRLLIADEPTTALDVTIQAQILDLLLEIQSATGSSLILITHDLAVVAEIADQVAVMYAGKVVEYGQVEDVFSHPAHPYTVGLLGSMLRSDQDSETGLKPIPGNPPNLIHLPGGCSFEPRCALSDGRELCGRLSPDVQSPDAGHVAACHYIAEMATFRMEQLGRNGTTS